MDADGLPLVGPGIDYTKVEAINQKRTIAFINHFITHTTRFLNRFSYVCEEKLEQLHSRIQGLEVSLSLLEGKLSSIPGLENVTVTSNASANTSALAATSIEATSTPAPPPSSAPQAPGLAPAAPQTAETAQSTPATEKPVSQDPRYMKYFKMLQVGVPAQGVKTRMAADGLNPDLLDTPDAPAPKEDDANDNSDSDGNSSPSSDSDASFSD